MKKANFTRLVDWGSKTISKSVIPFFGLFLGLLLSTGIQAQNGDCDLTCNDLVNVSLDGNCYRCLTPDDILENYEALSVECRETLEVEVAYPHYYVPMNGDNCVDGRLRGWTLVVKVIDRATENYCWGRIRVEDKYPPQIVCKDDTVDCYTYAQGYGLPTVVDNCEYPAWVDLISEDWINYDCEQDPEFVGRVDRHVIAYDVWGNTKHCYQTIYVEKSYIDSVYLVDDPDLTIECKYLEEGIKKAKASGGAGADAPKFVVQYEQNGKTYKIPVPVCASSPTGNVAGTEWQEMMGVVLNEGKYWPRPPKLVNDGEHTWIWPTDLPSTIQKNFGLCKVYAHFKDHIIPTCGHVYKIRREWKIVDWCEGIDTSLIQYIKIIDSLGPEVTSPPKIKVDSKPHDCKAEVTLKRSEVTYECWNSERVKAFYIVRYPDKDHPGKDVYESGYLDTERTIYLPKGYHTIQWTYTDLCGNHTDKEQKVIVNDVTPPTPVCDEITQTTLDPKDCWARVYARDLDDGSRDNCCNQLHFAVARMDDVDDYREKWQNEFINCGNEFYWDYKKKLDRLIERWINCFVFDEYIDVTGSECEGEQLVLRVYEACGLKPYDPHVFHGTRHDWFCYQTWEEYALYYTSTLDERLKYEDPKPDIYCDHDYNNGYKYGIHWGFDIERCGRYRIDQKNSLDNALDESSAPKKDEDIAKVLYTNCYGYNECACSGCDIAELEAEYEAAEAEENFFGSGYRYGRRYNDCMIELLIDDKEPPVCKAPDDEEWFCDGVPYWVTSSYCDVGGYTPSHARNACYKGSSTSSGSTAESRNREYYHGEFPDYSCSSPGPYSSGLLNGRCRFCVGSQPYDITKSPNGNDGDLDCQEGYYGGPNHDLYPDAEHYYLYDYCGYDTDYSKPYGNWRPIYCREWLELDSYDDCDLAKPNPKDWLADEPEYYSDNCDDITKTHVDDGFVNECGEGWFSRTWTITDGCGNEAKCVQKIYVYCRSDFEVEFPEDKTYNCNEVGDLSSLDGDAITELTGEPAIWDDECELIGISYVDQKFEKINEACYKILRTWTVIDWCKYSPDAHRRYPDVIVDDRDVASADRACIYRHLKDDGDGYIQYTQVIKVVDTEAPEVTCIEDTTICVYDNQCSNVAVELFLGDAEDDCTPDSKIRYRWFTTGNTYHGNGNTINTTLPIGTHKIYLVASDRCGNEDTCTMNLTLRDCKPPTPYCYVGIITVLMPNSGEVTIWASDLLQKAEDNCDRDWPAYSDIKESFSTSTSNKSKTYTCQNIADQGGINQFTVDVYVTDKAGNYDFCRTVVEIQYAASTCPGLGGSSATIAGDVKTEFKEAVESVEVELLKGGKMFKTGVDGRYSFGSVLMGGNYSILPKLDSDPLNGVSTLDLVIMQKHILGIEKLNSGYKVIAADINRSNSVSALDVVEARKLILGLYEKFPNNTSWRFIPKTHQMNSVENPWGFPEQIDVAKLTHDMIGDFVGVKVGDVNESNTPHSLMGSTVRSEGELKLVVEDRMIEKGEEVRIEMRGEGFSDIVGYQYTLESRGLELLGVESGSIEVDESNFGVLGSGIVTTSWNNVEGVSSESGLYTMIFRSGVSGRLSDVLEVSSRVTRAEAYRVNGEELNISLKYVDNTGAEIGSGYVLYQNTPNPFDGETKIGFVLPESGKAKLTILDVAGKVVKEIEGDYSRGYNEVNVKRSDLITSGVLYYKLEADNFTATRKMVLVD